MHHWRWPNTHHIETTLSVYVEGHITLQSVNQTACNCMSVMTTHHVAHLYNNTPAIWADSSFHKVSDTNQQTNQPTDHLVNHLKDIDLLKLEVVKWEALMSVWYILDTSLLRRCMAHRQSAFCKISSEINF